MKTLACSDEFMARSVTVESELSSVTSHYSSWYVKLHAAKQKV